MKHIAIDIRALLETQRTGVGEYVYTLLNVLLKEESSNQYYLFYNAAKGEDLYFPFFDYAHVHVIRTRWPNKILNIGMRLGLIALDQYIEKRIGKKLDCLFAPGFSFIYVSKDTRFLLTVHDVSFWVIPQTFSWKRRLWHWIIQVHRQLDRADEIFVPSLQTKRDIVSWAKIDEACIHVTPLALGKQYVVASDQALEAVKKRYRLPFRFILFLGTIEPRKNVDAVIDSFLHYKKQYQDPSIKLVIAGKRGWCYRPVEKKMKRHPDVIYVDYVEERDKMALYQLADLFVYPSLYEGFGFPVLEAMYAGVPVMCSARTSLPEVAGDAAYYVDPMNISALARGYEELLSSNMLRELLVQAGKERAEIFSIDGMVEKVREMMIQD